jgi:protoporphyrin/coproporphyrin ferrochelatase
VAFLRGRVADAMGRLGDDVRGGATVIFSAHSLPVRTVEDGSLRCKYCDCDDSCRYRDGLQETADLVAEGLDLPAYTIAWQSAGRTNDPWWGPPVEDVIAELARAGRSAVVVCSAGFVADHLEILYDLDIEAKEIAEEAGIAFARTEMPNADPTYLDVLAQVVRDHLAQVRV